jgi:hypothetical protein
MNIYIETNFIFEVTFAREQSECCENIIKFCEAGNGALVLPAFCIAESYEARIRREKRRTRIVKKLDEELRELSRSKPYQEEINARLSTTGLLTRISREEEKQLNNILERVLKVAEIIPLELSIIQNAKRHQPTFVNKPQDSIIYSSVLHHLDLKGGNENCFLNRNRRDFDDSYIEDSLMKRECKMLFDFVNGWNYIQHCVNKSLEN